MLNPVSMEIYITDHHELLWTLIEKPELGEGASAVWLARTAADVNAPERNAAYRERLTAHYEKETGDDYDVMSQYLLGLTDADALFALARSPDRRCEIAYYLGVKAKGEGRIRDAIDWFRVVVET